MNYNTKRWQNLRKRILKRDKYFCQYYKRFGKRVEATVVHHIFPSDEYPQWAYCEWNLVSLCNEAHEKMHDRDTHRITAEGLMFQNRLRLSGKIPQK